MINMNLFTDEYGTDIGSVCISNHQHEYSLEYNKEIETLAGCYGVTEPTESIWIIDYCDGENPNIVDVIDVPSDENLMTMKDLLDLCIPSIERYEKELSR